MLELETLLYRNCIVERQFDILQVLYVREKRTCWDELEKYNLSLEQSFPPVFPS